MRRIELLKQKHDLKKALRKVRHTSKSLSNSFYGESEMSERKIGNKIKSAVRRNLKNIASQASLRSTFKPNDWYKDTEGNYIFDSRVRSQQDLETYGLEGAYVGESFSDFNAAQIGDSEGNLFSMDGSLITSFLDGVEISNITYFDIYRDTQTSNSTTGTFTFAELTGFTLERPGPDTTTPNMRLRIPAGTYNVYLHYGSAYKNVLKLSNKQVSASRSILIHNGNYPKNTDGCILVGSSRRTDFVGGSVKKLNEIRAVFSDLEVGNIKVRIHNNFPRRGIPFLD
tara:strand:+ start:71 stop:922 length:852 start_codon:yes stop_codon:yes gene_type:complete